MSHRTSQQGRLRRPIRDWGEHPHASVLVVLTFTCVRVFAPITPPRSGGCDASMKRGQRFSSCSSCSSCLREKPAYLVISLRRFGPLPLGLEFIESHRRHCSSG